MGKVVQKYKTFEKCLGRWLVRGLLTLVFLLFLLFSGFVYHVYFDRSNLPDIKPLVEFNTPSIGAVYDSKDRPVVYLAHEYRWIVNYSKIPPVMINAILAAEDDGFFGHNGVDYLSFLRAIVINSLDTASASIKNRRLTPYFSQGASTLTQQIVRLYFLPAITKKENNNQLMVNNFFTFSFNKVGKWTGLYQTWHVNKIWRKFFEEWRMAFWVEEEFRKIYGSKEEAKKQIFARFASFTYFGDGYYGVDASPEGYFGKRVWELTYDDADKAALLAAMIKSPLLYSPRYARTDKDTERITRRRNSIIAEMADDGFIRRQDMAKFNSRPIEVIKKNPEKTSAPSAVGSITKELRNYKFSSEDLFFGRISIKSTIDLDIQKIGNEALEKGLAEYEKRHPEAKGEIQGSFVVLRNKDGGILAQSGGRKFYKGKPYKYSDLNRVVRARQAGSAFKPFVYLTAYMHGWKPTDVITDAPISVSMGYGRGRKHISNYDGKYLGSRPLEEMLYRSRNTPTLRLALLLGEGRRIEKNEKTKIEQTLELLGIQSRLHSDIDHKQKRVVYITSVLGASEMTLLELANAYRAMASGIYAQPYMVSEIRGRSDKVLFINPAETKPLEISKSSLEMIRSSLRKTVTQPGGTAYSLTLEKFPVPVMGKTGTTNDERNALFIGSTYGLDGITVSVRIDFDDNRELGARETGARTALPVFKEIMRNVYEKGIIKSQVP